jgi:hypothetical protein
MDRLETLDAGLLLLLICVAGVLMLAGCATPQPDAGLYESVTVQYREPVTQPEGWLSGPDVQPAIGDRVVVYLTDEIRNAETRAESIRWGVPSFTNRSGYPAGAPEYGDTAWPSAKHEDCTVWGDPGPELLRRCFDRRFVAEHGGTDYVHSCDKTEFNFMCTWDGTIGSPTN